MPIPSSIAPSSMKSLPSRRPSGPLPGSIDTAPPQPSSSTVPPSGTLSTSKTSSKLKPTGNIPHSPGAAIRTKRPVATNIATSSTSTKLSTSRPLIKSPAIYTGPSLKASITPPKPHQIPFLNLLAHAAAQRVNLPHFDSTGQLLPGWSLAKPASIPLPAGELLTQSYMATPPPATPGYFNARSAQIAHSSNTDAIVGKGKGRLVAPSPPVRPKGKSSGKRMDTFSLKPVTTGSIETAVSIGSCSVNGSSAAIAGPGGGWYVPPNKSGRRRKMMSAQFVVEDDNDELDAINVLLAQARAKQRSPRTGGAKAGIIRPDCPRAEERAGTERLAEKRGGLDWASELDIAAMRKTSSDNSISVAVRDRKRVSFSLPTGEVSGQVQGDDIEDSTPNLSLNWDSDMSDLTDLSEEDDAWDTVIANNIDAPTQTTERSSGLKIRIPALQDRPPQTFHPCTRCLKPTSTLHKQCEPCRLLWRQYRAIRARGERVPAGYFNMTPEDAMAEYEAKKARAKESKKARKKERKRLKDSDKDVPSYQTLEVLVGALKEGLDGFVRAQAAYMRHCIEEGRFVVFDGKDGGGDEELVKEDLVGNSTPMDFTDLDDILDHLPQKQPTDPKPTVPRLAQASSSVSEISAFEFRDQLSDRNYSNESSIQSAAVVGALKIKPMDHARLGVGAKMEIIEENMHPPGELPLSSGAPSGSAQSASSISPDNFLKLNAPLADRAMIPLQATSARREGPMPAHESGFNDQVSSNTTAIFNAASTSGGVTPTHAHDLSHGSTTDQDTNGAHQDSSLCGSIQPPFHATPTGAQCTPAVLLPTVIHPPISVDSSSFTGPAPASPLESAPLLESEGPRILNVPTAFIFEASSSIVLGPPPFSDYDIPRLNSVLHVLLSTLGITFTETQRTPQKEGLIVRMVCLHEVAVPALFLPSVGGKGSMEKNELEKGERWPVLPKRMRGDLEISIGRDRSHKLPGQKTVVRFQLMG